ncbi:hypothetical protein [Actinomadura parmotrematis]|uniref:hypothetical protein n=1 Tax=Actinomadura parmotrematis TaxID=2864039 RepID=UPI0027E25CF8|nr:hypothetical protein [Actinomadura parmotrematis]
MHIIVWRAAALLLAAPDQRFHDRRPMLRAALQDLPDVPAVRLLTAFLDHTARTPPLDLAAHRAGLGFRLGGYAAPGPQAHLLGQLPGFYRAAGFDAGGEEPDSLPVLLEYAADSGDDTLLLALRAPLGRLHRALEERATPYAAPVGAVRAALADAGQATFSDEDLALPAEAPLDAESLEPDEAVDEDSDLAGAAESLESLAVEPAEAAVEEELPEPRLSVR